MKELILIASIFLATQSTAQISEMFDREAAYQHLNGVVLVKNQEELVFEGCYGNANENYRNTPDTRFDIGSISKQFTATAILQLVYSNKIGLHDHINQHLGDLSSKRWEKVTIHHLLTHTSGIPSVYQTEQGIDIFFPEEREISLDDLISKFKDAKLLFPPGEEFSYNNSGYILLAAIIENSTGQSYSTYLEKEIFTRYELTATSFSHNAINTARPYYGYRKDQLKRAPVYHQSWFIGAGGVYSTVNDLSKWVSTINNDQFLSPELRTEFFKKHVKAGDAYYGYGWQITQDGIIEHDGGSAGFISFLSFNPTTKSHLVILTNRSFEDIHMLGKSSSQLKNWSTSIWDQLNNKKIEILPTYKSRSLAAMRFELKNGSALQLTPRDTTMVVTVSESCASRIIQNTLLDGKSDQEVKLLEIGQLLEKGKYWKLAKYCDGEMTFVCYSGLMSIGFNSMKKRTGGIESLIPYKVDQQHGLLNLSGPKGNLDIIVYFDEAGEVKGMFEHGFYSREMPAEMIAFPIDDNSFYVDGFPYGEQSVFLTVTENSIAIEQVERTIKGTIK